MLKHDSSVLYTQSTRCGDIVKIPGPQEFRANNANKTHPRKQQQQPQQPPEVRFNHAGQDDQQIKCRQPCPHFDKALKQQIHPSAEETLHSAGGDSNDCADYRQDKPEQN